MGKCPSSQSTTLEKPVQAEATAARAFADGNDAGSENAKILQIGFSTYMKPKCPGLAIATIIHG